MDRMQLLRFAAVCRFQSASMTGGRDNGCLRVTPHPRRQAVSAR